MNILVILAAIQLCSGYQWSLPHGGIADTPEVAHAKAEHFAAVAKAKAQIASSDRSWGPTSHDWEEPQHYAPKVDLHSKYHGPIALPPGYDKHGAPLPVLDTPEVAHAKAAALASIAKAGGDVHPSVGLDTWSHDEGKWSPVEDRWSGGEEKWSVAPQHHYAPTNKYHGPIAYSPGYDKHGAPLPVLDTPEVSHAKAEHFAAYAKAASANSLGGHRWRRSIFEVPDHYEHIRYHGPIALPPGYDKHGAPLPVEDTHEVAHAKAHHHELYHKIAAEHASGHHYYPYGGSIGHQSEHESSWNVPHYAAHIKYHGPIAHPPGYDKHGAPLPVLDTHEVAHAKAEHHHLYHKIAAEHASAHHHYPSSGYYSSWNVPHYASSHAEYHGAPHQVPDTHEVAHAKAHHHQLFHKIAAEHAAIRHHDHDHEQHHHE